MNVIWKKFNGSVLLQILAVLAVSFFCALGQTQNKGETEDKIKKEVETKDEVEIENEREHENEYERENEHEHETEIKVEERTNAALPDNDAIREDIYAYYRREDGEEISKEEVEAVKGKLPPWSRTIHDGEEFALMREWYDWSDIAYLDFHVFFSADLSEWREEDLEGLGMITGTVYVESSAETFPARALMYLTGTEEVLISMDADVRDVTGTVPDGAQIPEQIKSVTLYNYREGKYETLLHVLEKSHVETIMVRRDYDVETLSGFWLDDVAKIGSLNELILEDILIRVHDKASLLDCPLKRVEGYVDSDTDLGFVEKLAKLEEVSCGVLEEMELSPFLEKKGLSLYLYFCRQLAEFEELGYEAESYVVCPAFNRAVSWPCEPEDEKFPAIYQRREDQGRVVECFTERYLSFDDMWSFDPWLRVTDGSKVYELKPEVDKDFGFGGYRTDRMALVDINFDGVKDITLESGGFGTQMLRNDLGWIWNQSDGVYEYSPTYKWIANASVDSEHQIVRSFWRNWAGSHSWAIYRYKDGEFVEQSVLTEEFLLPDEIPEELEAPEGAGVIRWQEKIMENGEVAEVKNSYAVTVGGEETVYPEIYESYYAPDSYWGRYEE